MSAIPSPLGTSGCWKGSELATFPEEETHIAYFWGEYLPRQAQLSLFHIDHFISISVHCCSLLLMPISPARNQGILGPSSTHHRCSSISRRSVNLYFSTEPSVTLIGPHLYTTHAYPVRSSLLSQFTRLISSTAASTVGILSISLPLWWTVVCTLKLGRCS